jgi:hypothetical protein
MMKFLPVAIAALMIPSVALAKGPNHPNKGTHANHGKAKVMYVLQGTVYGYTAYDSSTSTPGSLMVVVNHSNRHGKLLGGQTLSITIGASTKVQLNNGVTSIASASPGDRGTVKIRAPRLTFKSAMLSDVENALMSQPAFQVVDRGPAS